MRDVICMRRASSRSCAGECALRPLNAPLSSRLRVKRHRNETHFGCTHFIIPRRENRIN